MRRSPASELPAASRVQPMQCDHSPSCIIIVILILIVVIVVITVYNQLVTTIALTQLPCQVPERYLLE